MAARRRPLSEGRILQLSNNIAEGDLDWDSVSKQDLADCVSYWQDAVATAANNFSALKGDMVAAAASMLATAGKARFDDRSMGVGRMSKPRR